MGINLTALAVFDGALGVGLGLGLQSIASNFISGIIILLDKSLTVGDYVELEDGKNRVGGDLLLTLFETLREHNIEIPFPQREVRVINEQSIGIKNTTP